MNVDVLLSHLLAAGDRILLCGIQASLGILLVLLIRATMGPRLGGKWLYVLWLIVMLRLAMPWVPQTRWNPIDLHWQPRTTRPIHAAQWPQMPLAQADDASSFTSLGSDNHMPLMQGAAVNRPASQMPATYTPWHLLYVAWVAGTVVLGGYIGRKVLRFRRRIISERALTNSAVLDLLEDCKIQAGIHTPMAVIVTDSVSSPALFGFVRPRLLLPAGLTETLTHDELRHVFLHELAHLKRYDVFIGWVMCMLQVLHWWNPLVWLAQSQMRADRELACDASAISLLGGQEPRQYGETIVRLLEGCSGPRYLPALAGILEHRTQLKRRITMIADFRPRSGWVTVFSLGLAGVVGLLSLTTASDAAASAPESGSPATMPASMPAGFVTLKPADLPKGSRINERGIIEDRIDWPFVNDPEVLGKWESIDFVATMDQFKPDKPARPADKLYLKGMVFEPHGKCNFGFSEWTKGLVIHRPDHTASKYVIKDIDGSKYMFFEWKSGDYTIYHRKPEYYVLKKLPANTPKFKSARELFGKDRETSEVRLGPDSHLDAKGNIVDKTDYPFDNDPQVSGTWWESVDFVRQIGDFKPGQRSWKGDLFLKELQFIAGGKMKPGGFSWTKGLVLDKQDHTASKYEIERLDGQTYMFFEWKSGDYTRLHRKPAYYVLRKLPTDTPATYDRRHIPTPPPRNQLWRR